MRILIVEDDPSLGATIQNWLELDGYAVDWINNGKLAQTALINQSYDCILLDRGLPGLSGDDLLRHLRQAQKTMPVLMITAQDALHDKIAGLDLGADDYLIKPFDLEELSARIRAAIRRASGQVHTVLTYGNVTLDPVSKEVHLENQSITLTAKEYALLHAMMLHPKQVITRAQLEDKLYSWGGEVESNAVEVHIHHLRKKLGSSFIRTIRNLGYTLTSAE